MGIQKRIGRNTGAQRPKNQMKAVITAGGEGTRLYPTSRAFPKEIIHFCGTPIIEYGIRLLRENNIRDIYIVTGRKKGALQDYFGSGELFGVNIAYITQEEPKGLGDAVLCTRHHLEDSREEDFVLLLGDTIFDNRRDLKEMLELHFSQGAATTTLVKKVENPERYGVVKFKNFNGSYGEIEDLYEKPKTQEAKKEFSYQGGWYAIAGLYILSKKIFSYLEDTQIGAGSELQLTDAIKRSLETKALAYLIKGRSVDVGNWEYLREERKSYNNMSEEELEEIISTKKNMVEKILTNKKRI